TPPATPPTCPLSLHDALPILPLHGLRQPQSRVECRCTCLRVALNAPSHSPVRPLPDDYILRLFHHRINITGGTIMFMDGTINQGRSEEHTSELQSRENLVCRLLLEKKK